MSETIATKCSICHWLTLSGQWGSQFQVQQKVKLSDSDPFNFTCPKVHGHSLCWTILVLLSYTITDSQAPESSLMKQK